MLDTIEIEQVRGRSLYYKNVNNKSYID